MTEDIRRECERLSLAADRHRRAEQEAAEAVAVAKAALREARAAFRVAEQDAVEARMAWVDYLLGHDHRALCRRAADRPSPREP